MRVEKVQLTILSRAVRSFLARRKEGQRPLVADEEGQARHGVIPHEEAMPRRRTAVWCKRTIRRG